MSNSLEFFSASVYVGVEGDMFCFAFPVKTVYGLLVGEVKEVMKQEEVLESENPLLRRPQLLN